MSPLYIKKSRGASAIGSGTVTAWVALPGEVFTQPYYSAVYLTADELDPLDAYTDEYKDRAELPVQEALHLEETEETFRKNLQNSFKRMNRQQTIL